MKINVTLGNQVRTSSCKQMKNKHHLKTNIMKLQIRTLIEAIQKEKNKTITFCDNGIWMYKFIMANPKSKTDKYSFLELFSYDKDAKTFDWVSSSCQVYLDEQMNELYYFYGNKI